MFRQTTFLEDYLENASNVPKDVVSSLTLMRELDTRAAILLARTEIEAADISALREAGREEEAETATQTLRHELRECKALSEEKIVIARQAYSLLDRHIRRLDADLRNFESELDSTANSSSATTNRSRSIEIPSRTSTAAADMPVDQNEPHYCFCDDFSFGKMIGCDNPSCRIEWFHYKCVGLSSSPKGKWYCPECRQSMKQQQQQQYQQPQSPQQSQSQQNN